MGNSFGATLNEANDLSEAGKFEEAIAKVDSVLVDYPEDSTALQTKANILCQAKRYDESIEYFKKAEEKEPDNLDIQEGLALACMFSNNCELAVKASDHAIKLGSVGGLMYHVKGNAYSKVNKFEDSVRAFDQYLLIDPHHISTLYNKGIVLSMAERSNQAIMCFDKVLSLNPKHIKTLISKGTLLVDQNEEEAMKCFEQAIEIEPKSHSAIYSKTLMLIKMNRAQEALDFCEKMLNVEVNSPMYYKHSGSFTPTTIAAPGLVSLGEDPIERVLIAKGRALFALGKYREAIHALEEAEVHFPKEPSILYYHAEALRLLGETDKAEQLFQQILTIDPKYDVYKGRNTTENK